MKIFVGNVTSEASEEDLRQVFESFGEVKSVTVVTDAIEGKARKFAFVTMPSIRDAQNAIKKMHGSDYRGDKLIVEKSRSSTKARASRRKRSASNNAKPSAAKGRRNKPRLGGRRRSKRRR